MYELRKLFKDSAYNDAVFSREIIQAVEKLIYIKNIKGSEVPYINCQVRGKEIKLTPEEAVRQLYIYKLIHAYGYDKSCIELERAIHFGREVKRADIAVFDGRHPDAEYIIVELKKPDLFQGKEQLKSYCNATGAIMGVWTNGQSISHYHRKDPNYFIDIPDIPKANQDLFVILNKQWYIQDLIDNDKLVKERKSLKSLILEIEREVLSNAGVNVFEEVFKLIYTKLYDEMQSGRDKTRALEFRNYSEMNGDKEADLKLRNNIQNLFDKAKETWPGVFDDKAEINLTPSHLAICVSSLERVKLFNSNLDVIDDAFEYLMNKTQKNDKEQYFTPRYVIDMCVKMLNPKANEKMIDTAAGSCGFPVHTIFYVWQKILKDKGLEQSHLFTAEKKPAECEDYVNNNVFAIDFDENAVRIARTLNLIAGDGRTNVMRLNTLDYDLWQQIITDNKWQDSYNAGWLKFRKMCAVKGDYSAFNFDIVMANPPFSGDIKESNIITKYELGKNPKGNYQNTVARGNLFIERNLNFLKPGGRMAIILPQGRFNNSSDKYIRDFIAERCRILAVVGLHGNVFKPHTGTKTSVLFVQKWDDKLCPRKDDYPIFFAAMQKPSKDNSGDKIFVRDESGEFKLDAYGHMIVDHDLFNHDNLTQDGIAEAFIEFAKRENLSFFNSSPSFNAERYAALMDGLECSEVLLSETKLDNEKDRLDSEFFQKKYIIAYNKIKAKEHSTIGQELSILTDFHQNGSYESIAKNFKLLDTPDYAYMVRTTDLEKRNYTDDVKYISKAAYDFLKKSRVYGGEVIINKIGSPGRTFLMPNLNRPVSLGMNQFMLKMKTDGKIDNVTLYLFLNTEIGKLLLERKINGTVPLTIDKEAVRSIYVPCFSTEFREQLQAIIKLSDKNFNTSRHLYASAQSLLLSALNFDSAKIKNNNNIAVKNFSQSFALTGRLDAEYYQPKYEELYNLLDKLNTKRLGDIVNIKKSIEPGSEYYGNEGVPFIRVSDVNKTGINMPSIKIPLNTVRNIESLYPVRDTILLSKDGSVGIAYKVKDDMQAVTSGALLHLNIKNNSEILPDYLTLVLNSEIVQLQAERDVNGAVIQHWRICDIENIIIPVLPHAIQLEISEKVQSSFELRRQAENLINSAVRAVEIAIEDGEDAAINYINA